MSAPTFKNRTTTTVVGSTTALDVNVVGGDITIDNAEINVELDAEDGDNVAIHNSSNGDELIINPDGSTDVNVIDSVLPDGAATETTVTLIADSLDIIDDWDETNRAKVNIIAGQAGVAAGSGVDSANTQRVSLATDIPLPTGSNVLGAITVNNAGGLSAVNIQDGGNSITVDGTVGIGFLPDEGQQPMASSISVAIASDQTAVPISVASLPLPTGAATAANQSTEITSLASIDAGIPAGLGQTTMVASMPIVIASDQSIVSVSIDGTTAIVPISGSVAQGAPNTTANRWPVQITDGTDLALVTAAGEQNVLATAQPGVDVGDVTINNAAGAAAVNIQDGGNSITVDGTVDTELPAAAALTNDTANPTVPGVGSFNMIRDGASWDMQPGDSTGGIFVQGPGAAGAATVGNPVLIGGFVGGLGNTAIMRVTAGGRPDVSINDSALPTGASTSANQSTEITSLQLLDDTVFVDNATFTDNSSKLNAIGFIFDDVAGTALTENDIAVGRIDSKRAMVMTIEDATTRGQKLTISSTGVIKTELPTAAALADNTANPTVPGVGAFLMGWDTVGANWDRVIVAPASFDNVTPASWVGLLTVSALHAYDGTNLDRVRLEGSLLGITVGGSVAHDAADAGNPVKMGGKATTSTSIQAAVSTTLDRTDAWLDLNGAQMIREGFRISYTANYRLTTRAYALSNAFGAAGLKQYATIYHTASSTKTVRLKRVVLKAKTSSAAVTYLFELRRLSATTAPATGNPAITPILHNTANGAAEATCLALPTTAGSEAGANVGWGTVEQQIGITAVGSIVNPIPLLPEIILWDSMRCKEGEDLIMRAGVAEGFAVIVDASAAVTFTGVVEITFTEE